jgi:hypothetical protein
MHLKILGLLSQEHLFEVKRVRCYVHAIAHWYVHAMAYVAQWYVHAMVRSSYGFVAERPGSPRAVQC